MLAPDRRRMLRLVSSLLDFSRIEAGQAASFAGVCRLAGLELALDGQAAWGEVDAAEVIRDDRPMTAPDTGRVDGRFEQVIADFAPAVRAAVIMPLHAGDGSVLRVMGLTWPQPREFAPADMAALDRAAGLLARATARISVAEREHQIAMSLQERLLELPASSTAAELMSIPIHDTVEQAAAFLRPGP